MNAAEEIRAEAGRRGWSQERLAEKAGVSRTPVAAAWNGLRPVSPQAAKAVLGALFPGAELATKRALLFEALCTVERGKARG